MDFEPKKKIKLGKEFFYKYIYVFVLGLVLILGVSYSLTFFKQNYQVVQGGVNSSGVTISLDSSASSNNVSVNASGLHTAASINEGILEFSKSVSIQNTSTSKGRIKVSLERTSGLNLTDLKYALVINGAIIKVENMPESGLILDSAIMGNETQNIELRFWPKDGYSGNTTTFVGNLKVDKNILNMTASDYIGTVTLTDTNNYVYFNCQNSVVNASNCEKWRIVKRENDRLVITNETNYSAVKASINTLTNSNIYDTTNTLNDTSLVVSMSADGKALYLKKTVEITGGDGSSTNPYVLTNNNYNVNDEKVIATLTYNNDGVTTTQPIYYGKANYISKYTSADDFIGWATTNGATTVEYALGDIVSFTTNTNLYVVLKNSILREMRSNVSTGTLINFANASGPSNGEGIYILPGTENDTYPIYYYRGAVNNNNVIFGGFCWQIVRTTDTGGIKMIYNGVATGNGATCENTAHADRVLASNSVYSSTFNSASDVGYMSNAKYNRQVTAPTSGAYFGTSVEYGEYDANNLGTNYYRLVDDGNGSVGTTLDSTHHYSCDETTAGGICEQVRYYYYNSGTEYYYINLTNGEKVEDALYKMTGNGDAETKVRNSNYVLNQNDSTIKGVVDSWFRTNLTNIVDNTKRDYREYLEDTVFCNDRSYKTESLGDFETYVQSGWNPNGGDLTKDLHFGVLNKFFNNWYSTTNVPNLTCLNETDRFSMANSVAHLNYPVGLLTVDEVILAGAPGNSVTSNNTYYLYTGNYYWSMTPFNFSRYYSYVFRMKDNGSLSSGNGVGVTHSVRPVISLKHGTEFEIGGEGTPTKPYVVKYN